MTAELVLMLLAALSGWFARLHWARRPRPQHRRTPAPGGRHRIQLDHRGKGHEPRHHHDHGDLEPEVLRALNDLEARR